MEKRKRQRQKKKESKEKDRGPNPHVIYLLPVGWLMNRSAWRAFSSPSRVSLRQWRPFWRPLTSLTGQLLPLDFLLSGTRGGICGDGGRKGGDSGEWLKTQFDAWTIGWMNEWSFYRDWEMGKSMNEWKNKWINERANEWMNKWMYKVYSTRIWKKRIVLFLSTFHCFGLKKKNHHWLCPSAIRCRRWWSWCSCHDSRSGLLNLGEVRSMCPKPTCRAGRFCMSLSPLSIAPYGLPVCFWADTVQVHIKEW